ncbi:MAG TPA: hypothetical protein VFS32_05960 [Candidatus Limnocylindrales bacterium]|nr:hypothetical protein [Candidatus Limnocylindrales bacterium]
MSDPREDLRSTEESIRWDRDAIRTLEGERASLTSDDPNIAHLTERIEGLAKRVRAKWAAEGDLLAELRTALDERRRRA